MNIMVMLYLLLSLIQTQEDETCARCYEHRVWEESNCFIYAHATSIFEASDANKKRKTIHPVHLTCLLNYAKASKVFEADNFTKLNCPYCGDDIGSSMLISIQKELHNLKSPEKRVDAVKNISLWHKVLGETPKIIDLLVNEKQNVFHDISDVLSFIRDYYPNTIKENKHKILVTFIEWLLHEYDFLPLSPEDLDYCKILSDCSSEDILLVYDEWYSKMAIYMRNRFNFFIIGLVAERSQVQDQGQKQAQNEKSAFSKAVINLHSMLSVEDLLEVWKNIFYSSGKTGNYTQADEIFKEVDREIKEVTNQKGVLENPQCDVFVSNQVVVSKQSSKEKNFVFDAVFFIPAVLCKLREENKPMYFKKCVFIKAIEFLHSNLSNLHDITTLAELLFMYLEDPWYNVIYEETSPATSKKIDISVGERLKKVSDAFLGFLVNNMQNCEYEVCLNFLGKIRKECGSDINFKSKLRILDFLFEVFDARVKEMPSLLNYIIVFDCGYFAHNSEQRVALRRYIALFLKHNNAENI